MNFRRLAHKNIIYFTRYYKLVAVAALIAVTVITGSLVVGDSVRTTLIKRVTERLGDTETIIFARNSFMSEELLREPLFGEGKGAGEGGREGERKSARGILLTKGFISRSGSLVPVFVWGVDDMNIAKGTAKVNQALARELEQYSLNDIALRLPGPGLVPSGSLFVTENYTGSLRLSYDGVVEAAEGGNISMKNEQAIPFNIFVNRHELAEAMEVTGKINLITDSRHISAAELESAWNYSTSGLSVNRKDNFTEIISDRVFLQEKVTEAICRNNNQPNRMFSYLANSIGPGDAASIGPGDAASTEPGNASIPYSFVTAMDKYKEYILQNDEIILSDYSAKRLGAKIGDAIRLTYFTSQDLKTLVTDTVRLRVRKIVPLDELVKDNTLSAEFPGLSDVERCTDWDSDLPVDMDLITAEDEKYWELYRSTPKAIVAYNAVAGDWGNAYGNATAIRVADTEPDLSELRADMFGIQLVYPREQALYAAKNGVDFSGLFLALGFFIIVSAMLLMAVPISEMLHQRRHETALLKSLGYTPKRVAKLLWMESAPVVVLSSGIGVIAGLLYTGLIMWLLGNIWKGATQTDGFSVYPGITALTTGLLAGMGLSLWLLRIVITRSLKDKRHSIKHKKFFLKGRKIAVVISCILSVGIIGINFIFLHSVALFMMAGIILIGTAALCGDYLICLKGSANSERLLQGKLSGKLSGPSGGFLPGKLSAPTGGFSSEKLTWSTLYATRKQVMLSFFALATGVFIVFSVGLNRKGFADSSLIRTGTGGYSLWCESSIPVYHNMATQAGREKLSLNDLPVNTEILQCLRYSADDASCLNLNKVSSPTVLGVDMKSLSASSFGIDQSLYSVGREAFFDQMQARTDSVYPAMVDATVLTWSLGMSLGDTLLYEDDKGQSVAIILAGTLSNSVFQGNILIDRSLFSEIWKETTGSEIFLLKLDEPDKEEVKTLLSQALNEYGVRVSTTNERLAQFNTVTDTYLTIFMTLGGLGLLLGIVSFIVVVRKNLSMRHGEINLYRVLGFTDRKIEQILYRENLPVPLYALATGVISSMVGVSNSFMNTGIWIWLLAILFTIFFAACVLVFVRKSVKREVEMTKLFYRINV